MNLARKQPRRANGGYSLVELLLTLSLLLLFTGLAVVSLNTLSQGSSLSEGTIRFETMLRFARAEAAHSGRRVRVSFVQDTNQVFTATQQLNHVELSWEPDPISQPDVFQELLTTQWGVQQVNETVNVQAVRLFNDTEATPDETTEDGGTVEITGTTNTVDTTETAAVGGADFDLEDPNPAPLSSITFNPNGSCDSAEITLAGRNSETDQRVVVRVEGFSGLISRVESPEKDADAKADASAKPQATEVQRRVLPAESK